MATMTGMQVQCPACPETVPVPCRLIMSNPMADQATIVADTKPLREHLEAHNAQPTGDTCSHCKLDNATCLQGQVAGRPACCPKCSEGNTHGAA